MSAFVGTLQIRTFDTSAARADINIARQYVYNRMFIRVNDKTQEKKQPNKGDLFSRLRPPVAVHNTTSQ